MIGLENIFKIVSEQHYPLVYVPYPISECIKEPNFYEVSDSIIINEYSLDKPEKPYFTAKKPVAPSTTKTLPYKKPSLKYGFWFIFIPIIVIVISVFNQIKINDYNNNHLYFFDDTDSNYYMIFFSILSIIAIFMLKTTYIIKYKSVPLTKEEMEQRIIKYKNEEGFYQLELNQFNELMRYYETRMTYFRIYIRDNKQNYLLKKYHQYLRVIEAPKRSDKLVLKGRTEDSFLVHLLKYFSDEIKINMQLNTHGSSFYPDFVYESKIMGFYIDIEIDEQYDLSTKKPIHYIGGDDEGRNDFFLKKNWFIIRFAEEQVKKHPEECCRFIKSVIDVIESPTSSNYELKPNFPKIRRWTYEETYLDGKKNKRDL